MLTGSSNGHKQHMNVDHVGISGFVSSRRVTGATSGQNDDGTKRTVMGVY